MRILALFTLLTLISFAAPVRADDLPPLCPSKSDIPVVIHPVFGTPRYDTGLSMAQLQSIKSRKNDDFEQLTLGLTDTRSVVRSTAQLMRVTYPNGSDCSYLRRVEVYVGYQELTVYIPREIPQGTCGFDQIKGHELKHVATDEAVLKEHLTRFYDRLKSYLSYNEAYLNLNSHDHGSGLDESVHHIETDLDKIVSDEFRAMTQELKARQADVDSPAEYKRVNTSCNGQLMAVAEDFRRGRR